MYCHSLDQLLTFSKLGITNVLRVFIHRLKIKFKYYQFVAPVNIWRLSKGDCFVLPFSKFSINLLMSDVNGLVTMANRILSGNWCFYFYHWFYGGCFPNWFWSPFTGKKWDVTKQHWSTLSFFEKPGDDIKNIWELSRFYWAPQLVLAYRFTGNASYCERLNHLIQNWCDFNRPQVGYQWLCAQEVAIRLSNFLLADQLLYDGKTVPSLSAIEFVEIHVKRILLTMSYAIAQDNNHAISEAAALYFAGVWLFAYTQSSSLAKRALSKGKFWLENRVRHLIASDGSFSQHSVTYHRLVLDILSLCIWVQKKNKLPPFSSIFKERYRSAFEWLVNMVDPYSGEAPNLGANDGTMFFKLDACDYRDFRPTLQLASVFLYQKKMYSSGPWDLLLSALGIEHEKMPVHGRVNVSTELYDGGFVKFGSLNHWLLLRYSKFRFRPSHADIFHVDLWVGGKNIFQDSGSYSYNLEYLDDFRFKGTVAHNTVQLDDHEQMPSLSRFLWGSWVKTKVLNCLKSYGQELVWCGEYRDYLGGKHRREVRQCTRGYLIIDRIFGYKKQAVLRWHICAGDWIQEIDGWRLGKIKLIVSVNGKIVLPIKNYSWYSLYYQQKEINPVLEVMLGTTKAVVETFVELE
ncbi:MAG: heparinase II/III family protein [Coxiellaceae bacterium]|jgi:hypothetical protein|nr:heparinase II/III family protein [Coxiellaceae bacterium]